MTKERRRQLALVARVNRKINRWGFECKYHDWNFFQLLQKAVVEVGITQADYFSWRQVYAE